MIETHITAIPNFPSDGIVFRDLTTLFQNATAFSEMLDLMCEPYQDKSIDRVVGLEARGFIVGAAVASRLNVGFVGARKKGKLPRDRVSIKYELEYGTDELELHKDAIPAGASVLLIDDLLATGGTACAGLSLIEQLGGVVEACAFVVNLPKLGGEAKLARRGHSPHCLCTF